MNLMYVGGGIVAVLIFVLVIIVALTQNKHVTPTPTPATVTTAASLQPSITFYSGSSGTGTVYGPFYDLQGFLRGNLPSIGSMSVANGGSFSISANMNDNTTQTWSVPSTQVGFNNAPTWLATAMYSNVQSETITVNGVSMSATPPPVTSAAPATTAPATTAPATTAPAGIPVLNNQHLQWANTNTGSTFTRFLDCWGGACTDPANKVELWDGNNNSGQKWTWKNGGLYSGGQLLATLANGTANGTQVIATTDSGAGGTGGQQWKWQKPPGGIGWQLMNPMSGRCLDISGGVDANGSQLQVWDCNTSWSIWQPAP